MPEELWTEVRDIVQEKCKKKKWKKAKWLSEEALPSCSAFIHRVALEEVSGHRVLIKSKTEKSGSFCKVVSF